MSRIFYRRREEEGLWPTELSASNFPKRAHVSATKDNCSHSTGMGYQWINQYQTDKVENFCLYTNILVISSDVRVTTEKFMTVKCEFVKIWWFLSYDWAWQGLNKQDLWQSLKVHIKQPWAFYFIYFNQPTWNFQIDSPPLFEHFVTEAMHI